MTLKSIEPNKFTYKILPQEECLGETPTLAFQNNESIRFYIELSWVSFFRFLIISIPVAWGILLLINAILKFIVLGRPFLKGLK
ncbi:MAG: hypothetical protein ABIC36_00480 [bacterium]